ncbi:Ribosome hibernation promoting factor [BD1-7 clade bacterium]|uniref:Ribosome hibernation promoting factor n=1 Tax=BD1-7 clade bacterium TaxID=2029982 RepID=A0A5S9MQ35_9GAMM|nr:Ribosome hibernation promoting factor [BD1-7 clade bacterium]CAA0081273.1 Ribosome hibernation promoting factor [BD1-7 clade bacterium]CAA0084829.1 Ribosome hibernation promoting factor [BD1-7 clade bacterium]
MQINISGHHVEITEPLREFVNTKMERLERHSDNITDATVTLSVEKSRQKAEASVRLAGGDVFAHSESTDMYASIDTLVDKLDRQIIKHKEKIVGRRQKAG